LLRWAMLLLILLALARGGYLLWRYFTSYESTDDAQIDGHLNAVSARINGHVDEVLTENERYVNKGDVLVRIDPRDYEVAVAKAAADLEDAQASLRRSNLNVPITSANTSSQLKTARSTRADAVAALEGAQRQLKAAQARVDTAQAQLVESEANSRKASDDANRYRILAEKDQIARQQYDTAVSAADAARATVNARGASVVEAQENVRVAQSSVDQANQRIVQADASITAALTAPQQVATAHATTSSAQAQVDQKKALLDQAALNLSYCTIHSPVSGIVGKKTVEVGHNVSPGQQLMAVVPLDDLWVTANFKETQLRNMRPGQRVRFTVDAYDREYTGRVEGIGGAAGSRFALLPPENATGNFVKIVQRIPVRIDIDPGQNEDRHLRPGMSVVPKVYVR